MTRSKPARVHAVGLLATALAAAFSSLDVAWAGGESGRRDGAMARETSAARDDARCAACHQAIAAEAESSLHRHAADDRDYLASLAREPLPFCRACHAPAGLSARPTNALAARVGVGCTTCHGAREHLISPRATATTRGCATCHEFDFPSGGGDKMQRTTSEGVARDSASDSAPHRTCASCHMPRVGPSERTHTSHAFVASRDDAMLRHALLVDATRPSPSEVVLVLSVRDVGHEFPTGDLFRRLEVVAEARDADRLVARRRVYLARKFGPARGAAPHVERAGGPTLTPRAEAGDTRIAGLRVVELDLGAPAVGRAITWRVTYQRVDHPNGDDPRNASLFAQTVLAEGDLPSQMFP